jgi:hypothetical protein
MALAFGRELLCISVIVLALGMPLHAATRAVPGTYSTIQAALDACVNGDVVLVADGTYTGSGNRALDFKGKAITLQSQGSASTCIIDCQGFARGLYFHNSETNSAVVRGFTIRSGSGDFGGALRCTSASPLFDNCIFTNNAALSGNGQGGAIYCTGSSSARFQDCVILNNTAHNGGGVYLNSGSTVSLVRCSIVGNTATWGYGGGLATYGCSPTLANCRIVGNSTVSSGGGMYAAGGAITLINNTIAQNRAVDPTPTYGGGLYGESSASCTIRNCIIWGNEAANGPQLAFKTNAGATVKYTDSQGGLAAVSTQTGCTVAWQTGNTDTNPLFASPGAWGASWTDGDYHLKSQTGRWSTSEWVADAVTSPCIDAGDPADSFTLEPSPNGGRINMGAYGNTDQASKSVTTWALQVSSQPVTGIPVSGTPAGLTNYSVRVTTGSAVSISVPGAAVIGGTTYTFLHWTVNGVPLADKQALCSFTITQDSTATAVYQPVPRTLGIQSDPVPGIDVAGTPAGTTDYTVQLVDGSAIALTAPASATIGGWTYAFQRWQLNDINQPDGQTTLSFTLSLDSTAIAFYQAGKRPLSVKSTPISGITIGGTPGGVTDYVSPRDDQDAVSLTAPSSATSGGKTYYFARWTLNGERQSEGQTALSFTMNEDKTAVAEYTSGVNVVFPSDSGVHFERGGTYLIRWQATSLSPKAILRIELRDAQGGRWVLAAKVKNSKGSYKWAVGKWKSRTEMVYPDGDGYRIFVSTLDGSAEDGSDNEFVIVTP